jgi:hypothetical protein
MKSKSKKIVAKKCVCKYEKFLRSVNNNIRELLLEKDRTRSVFNGLRRDMELCCSKIVEESLSYRGFQPKYEQLLSEVQVLRAELNLHIVNGAHVLN